MAPPLLKGFLFVKYALFLLSLRWMQVQASFSRRSLSHHSNTLPDEAQSPLRAGRQKQQPATSYWAHAGGGTEILQMEIDYPGSHPHERYLQEEEGISKYGIRPNDPDSDDGGSSSSNNNNPQEEDTISSPFRAPRVSEETVSISSQTETSESDNDLQLQEEWDDDFDRTILSYQKEGSQNFSYQPIRIRFITSPLDERRGESAYLDQQLDKFVATALPEAASIWASHLSVYPVAGPIQVSQDVCYGSFASSIDPGSVSDADLVIIVSAFDELVMPGGDSIPVCGPHSLALGAACNLDQWDRPVIGFVNLCLKRHPETEAVHLDELVSEAFKAANGFPTTGTRTTTQNNTNSEEDKVVNPTSIMVHELAHTLGFDSYLFKFFRNGETGEPLTPRPFGTTFVQCVNGGPITDQFGFPSEKVLQIGLTQNGDTYFDLVTPKVAQIARNFFDCQSLKGARLENYESSCVGSHFDERLFLTEIMSPALAWRNNLLSPLTLALMEDTGWYKVNYENASVPTFGLGAGCDFVDRPCIVNDRVPAYAKDYFCDHPIRLRDGDSFFMEEESWRKVTCDPSHQYWAMCDLWDASTIPAFLNVRFPQGNQETSYFSDDNLLVSFPQADYCPLAIEFLGVDCTQEESDYSQHRERQYFGEEVGPASRCINAFSDISVIRSRRIDRPACMHLECDDELRKVVLGTGEFRQVCEFDGQVLHIPSTEADYLECPRLATVCPHLFCPASCSGRGVCDYNDESGPKCNCFDPDDPSEGCYQVVGEVDPIFLDPTSSFSASRVSKQGEETPQNTQNLPSDGVDSEYMESLAVPLSSGQAPRLSPSLTVVLLVFCWFL